MPNLTALPLRHGAIPHEPAQNSFEPNGRRSAPLQPQRETDLDASDIALRSLAPAYLAPAPVAAALQTPHQAVGYFSEEPHAPSAQGRASRQLADTRKLIRANERGHHNLNKYMGGTLGLLSWAPAGALAGHLVVSAAAAGVAVSIASTAGIVAGALVAAIGCSIGAMFLCNMVGRSKLKADPQIAEGAALAKQVRAELEPKNKALKKTGGQLSQDDQALLYVAREVDRKVNSKSHQLKQASKSVAFGLFLPLALFSEGQSRW